MKLKPTNKRVLINPIKTEIENELNQFVGISKKRPDNILYQVLDKSDDCTVPVSINDTIVVEGNMAEESKIGETSFYTIKENFIIGVVKNIY